MSRPRTFEEVVAAENPTKPHSRWHLDEVSIKIDGRLVYLWRAVDAEGEILDVLVQSKRAAAGRNISFVDFRNRKSMIWSV